jgi:hypothetical protein
MVDVMIPEGAASSLAHAGACQVQRANMPPVLDHLLTRSNMMVITAMK